MGLKKIIIIIMTGLLFMGCSNGLISPETGTLQLELATRSTTVFPGTLTPVSYDIHFSGHATAVKSSLTGITATSVTISDLAEGDWTLSVEARNSGGELIASGSVNTTVTAGAVNSASVSLQAQMSGSGTLGFTLLWPSSGSGAQVDTVEGQLISWPGNITSALSLTVSGNSAVYNGSLASGSYYLTIELKKGSVLYSTFSGTIQVYDNLVSSGSFILTEEDFTAAPAAPTSLGITQPGDRMRLSWTDNSYVETGYSVERSTASDYSSPVSFSVTGSSVIWDDVFVPVPGTVYYYRIKALNSFGSSSWLTGSITANGAPTASGVTITGSTDYGNTLSGSYSYSDPDSDSESGTLYQWYSADSAGGTQTSVSGANGQTFTPDASLSGKYLFFEVTPEDDAGITGLAVLSAAFGPVTDGTNPIPGSSGSLTVNSYSSTGIEISWASASDAVSAAGVLQYKVVFSESDNLTLININSGAGGIVTASDWSTGLSSASLSSLTADTLYYVNVLVKDESGNTVLYSGVSQKTLPELGLNITVMSPQNETITLDQSDGITVTRGATLNVAVSESFTSYLWKLDGDVLPSTGNSVSVLCDASVRVGTHVLTLIVVNGGKVYSESLRFVVNN